MLSSTLGEDRPRNGPRVWKLPRKINPNSPALPGPRTESSQGPASLQDRPASCRCSWSKGAWRSVTSRGSFRVARRTTAARRRGKRVDGWRALPPATGLAGDRGQPFAAVVVAEAALLHTRHLRRTLGAVIVTARAAWQAGCRGCRLGTIVVHTAPALAARSAAEVVSRRGRGQFS